ncbi:hypothetical protein, partial [Lactobacillus helveticus]|uniref:hypothetical protein n=1 Tax=Lactobacillus helveticus TaxID=1587 RepID=UPI003FEE19CD
KRPIKLKLRVELIVFQYLRVGYFPDTFMFLLFIIVINRDNFWLLRNWRCNNFIVTQPFF